MQTGYTASSIKVLEGLEAVRMRPGMYIGSTGSSGLHHMLWEIVDNAIDEAMGGYADEITVTLHPDASVTVTDNGRGVPVDINPQLNISGVEVVYTRLHAGGKFGSENYAYSGGLHGVGASVVNALSRWMSVEIHLDGKVYRQEYVSKKNRSGKMQPGRPTGPLKVVGKTYEKGTRVTFLPDADVFDHLHWNHDTIAKRLKELAFLNKGLKIAFTDERSDEYAPEEYAYDGGLMDFVQYLNEDKTPLFPHPILLEGMQDGILVSVAIQYTDAYTESIFSYVNNIPTIEGGMHETGFRAAVSKVMGDYIRRNNLVKEKEIPMVGEDFREGMTAVIAIRMQNPQFEGQTKTKLGNTDARRAVETLVGEKLAAWLDDLKHAETTGVIMDKVIKSAKVRLATRKAKELARKKNRLEAAPLVGKLASCTGRNPSENELFIVEGDSAGGSAKQGRDRRFQAILPLRGKPLNAEKKRIDAVLANEEFRSIITALGCGFDDDFNIATLRFHKIIILSDADQDGAHIRAILLTFFFRYMKELITNGHLYIGLPPLYQIRTGKTIKYAYDDRELKELTKGKSNYTLQRYKGLGEMDAEQLWETTMNPNGRKLLRISLDDVAEADRRVTTLMGDKVDRRRNYIARYANFNRYDEFEKLGGAR
ncbi:MAG: DNA gyrase/topoisomerase IV subunit B [Christensenellales bacterium]|jgi:DNA gyrase subunit B